MYSLFLLKGLECQTQERILNALERIKLRPEIYITKLVGESAYKFRVGDLGLSWIVIKGN